MIDRDNCCDVCSKDVICRLCDKCYKGQLKYERLEERERILRELKELHEEKCLCDICYNNSIKTIKELSKE